MLLIFVPNITERIKYTFKICFNNVVKTDYKITDNFDLYQKTNCPKFWYSEKQEDSSFGIFSNGLLFLSSFPFKQNPIYSKNDIFEFVFLIVTQSQHYTNTKDKIEFDITKPIINIKINDFIFKLTKIYPDLQVELPVFQFIPTIDVDIAFKYKYKNFFRTLAWFIKDFFSLKFEEVKERFLCIIGLKSDIWNNFEEIIELHNHYILKPIFFFLVGKRGKFDKNISIKKSAMQNIIKKISERSYEIGFHSSAAGVDNFNLWKIEKQNLEKIIGKKITKTRQHYIKLNFPQTFQNYLELGILDDFSLIYPENPGFRLGVTVPIKFFDLEKNQETNLTLYPSVIMDVSLKKYKNFTIEEAKKFCREIVSYYKKYGGIFVSVWHNESLSNDPNWKDWRIVYRFLLEEILISNSTNKFNSN